MNIKVSDFYVDDVRRFGSSQPYTDEEGKRSNLSHGDDFSPDQVQTDGRGHVTHTPLVWRKPCYGRLERRVRGAVGGKPWVDEDGQRRVGSTACDTCARVSPGIFEACGNIASERAGSDADIMAAFDAWMDACGDDFGARCFIGPRALLWHAFLQAIIDHGGWSNVNDDQVKLEALRLKKEQADRRRTNRKARLQRAKAAYLGKAKPMSPDYLDAIQTERDRRATHLKSLRDRLGRTRRDMLWLKMLRDESCDRIADVWQTREMLLREATEPTGQAITERMMVNRQTYGLEKASLGSRVYDDLKKRLARLEDDSSGQPIWSPWTYMEPASGP